MQSVNLKIWFQNFEIDISSILAPSIELHYVYVDLRVPYHVDFCTRV